MRPLKHYKSRTRKGTKNKIKINKKSNLKNVNAVSKAEIKQPGKNKPGKKISQDKIKLIENINVESLTDINSYKNAIADLSNKAINDSNNCDLYIQPLFLIIHKKGGGNDETKSIASNLAIKSTGILLSHLSTSGLDEESVKAKEILDKFTGVLSNKLTTNPVLVGLLVSKILASDIKSSNDSLLSLCLICCNKSTYKQQSTDSTRSINENLEVIKAIFQIGSMNDCARVLKMINSSPKHSFNPKLVSLIPLINLRSREFEANAYFQFQFNKVSKDVREKLRYSAVTETPDIIAKCKKIILEHVLALYFKIIKGRVKSCELLTICFNDLCNFIHFLNIDIQQDILKEIINYQEREMCPLTRLTSLDCSLKIMKYSQSSLNNDVSWVLETLIEKIDLTDMPLGTNLSHSQESSEFDTCKDKIPKTLSIVMDHLMYFINISCDIQFVTLLIYKLLCFAMLSDVPNAKVLLNIVFNLVKKFPQLKDIFDQDGMISSTGKCETCHWHSMALGCHFAPEIRELVTQQLMECRKFTLDF